MEWNREFRRPEPEKAATDAAQTVEHQFVEEDEELVVPRSEHSDRPLPSTREPEPPVFAAPGTLEEETIDEEEADAVRYAGSSDQGYDEFEEDTPAAGQPRSRTGLREVFDVRETAAAIPMSSLAESGAGPAGGGPAAGGEIEPGEQEW